MITANNYTLHADAVAGRVDRLARAYDYYEYINAVDDPAAHVRQIRADILAEDPVNVNDIISWLLALIQAGGTLGREAAVILASVENIRNAAGLAPANL